MDQFHQYLANHHGVFTRAHARGFGLTDTRIQRRLRNRDWIRVAPRVFRVATAPDSWAARARASALSVGGHISHTSALRVWRVDGHLAQSKRHVVVAADRCPSSRLAAVHRVSGLRPEDELMIDGIPVVSPTRAVVDSAGLLSVGELDATVDAVVRQRLTTIDGLRAEIARLGSVGRKGLGQLSSLLADRASGGAVPDSRFNRLVGRLLVAGGLPEPEYEYSVRYRGRFAGRADLAYPAVGLLIECDSARWHRNKVSFENDPRRRNRLILAGYRVLSFTWDDYANRPSALVAVVAAAYDENARGLQRNMS